MKGRKGGSSFNIHLLRSSTLKTEQNERKFTERCQSKHIKEIKLLAIRMVKLRVLLPLYLPPMSWWSTSGLSWLAPAGQFILRRVSHLDAFSGYLCPT